jgi:hypothetical protein
MRAPGHALSHALVVLPHWLTCVIGIAGSAHEGNLEDNRPSQKLLPYGMTSVDVGTTHELPALTAPATVI